MAHLLYKQSVVREILVHLFQLLGVVNLCNFKLRATLNDVLYFRLHLVDIESRNGQFLIELVG